MNTTSPSIAESPEPRTLRLTLIVTAFVPIGGILSGSIALLWGLADKNQAGRRQAKIAVTGMLLANVAIPGLLLAFLKFSPTLVNRSIDYYAQRTLDELVLHIEDFRVSNGRYPASLQELHDVARSKSRIVTIIDPTPLKIRPAPTRFQYYLLDSTHYEVFGVGNDIASRTDDDLYPRAPDSPASAPGLSRSAARPQ